MSEPTEATIVTAYGHVVEGTIQHKALDLVLPSWVQRRAEAARIGSGIKELQAELKRLKARLDRLEGILSHVAECTAQDCEKCLQIVNGASGR